MSLPGALTWADIDAAGGPGGDGLYLGRIKGLGQPGSPPTSRPRASGGSWGGICVPSERTITADVWLDADKSGVRDYSLLFDLYTAMQPRPRPTDELPLSWSGLMWPPGDWCVFARPIQCDWATDEEGVHGGAPGIACQWIGSDPTIYSLEQIIARLVSPEAPVSSTQTFEAPNAGIRVPWSRRAVELRMTAHGTLVGPWLRVDHADGTFERVSWPELTMTGGQVLTAGLGDNVARLSGRLITGPVRSYTGTGEPSRVARWWQLHRSNGTDGGNVFTWGATSGSWSGYVKVRSQW